MSTLTPELLEPLIEQLLQRKCGDLAFGEAAKQCVDAGYSRDEVLRVLKPMWESRFSRLRRQASTVKP